MQNFSQLSRARPPGGNDTKQLNRIQQPGRAKHSNTLRTNIKGLLQLKWGHFTYMHRRGKKAGIFWQSKACLLTPLPQFVSQTDAVQSEIPGRSEWYSTLSNMSAGCIKLGQKIRPALTPAISTLLPLFSPGVCVREKYQRHLDKANWHEPEKLILFAHIDSKWFLHFGPVTFMVTQSQCNRLLSGCGETGDFSHTATKKWNPAAIVWYGRLNMGKYQRNNTLLCI